MYMCIWADSRQPLGRYSFQKNLSRSKQVSKAKYRSSQKRGNRRTIGEALCMQTSTARGDFWYGLATHPGDSTREKNYGLYLPLSETSLKVVNKHERDSLTRFFVSGFFSLAQEFRVDSPVLRTQGSHFKTPITL